MNAAEIFGPLVVATYFVFLAIEHRWPGRVFPARRAWEWIGVGFFALIATLSAVAPLLLPVEWMAAHRWLDGTRLGTAGGAIAGFLAFSIVMFAWHRALHSVPLLWRAVHQLHHSPNRVDISGSAVLHPTEMAAQILLQLFVMVIVLGLDPLAAAIANYVTAFYGMFRHWNVRTPHWVGYLIQRPEAHCVHHRKGVHCYNYSDFPPWDMLFGTFRNPRRYLGECGFEHGADRKLGAMLAFADVNAGAYGPGNLGQKPGMAPPRLAGRPAQT